MKPPIPLFRMLRPSVLLAGSILAAPLALAQTAPAAITPQDLARYDANKNGVLDPDELAARAADQARAANAAPGTDEVVQLTPFEVSGDDDQGYLASSTLSGTRLNSKLEDLAASISVVTKQQLLDTASTDINDVFMYEAGTEGIYQFTSFTVDRGLVTDDVSANPHNATRMRGLSSANVATNGFATTLPFDSYNVDAVEISRGPNSGLFGLGNAGGGVNVIGSKANLSRETSTFSVRGDSYGGYRGSFDLNRPLIKDKLAARLLGVYEEKGFEREPSEDTTRRLQLAVTFKPFRNTTLRASFESYRNFYSRPNSTTPRDMTTDWVASGRPSWNPITHMVNFGDGRPSLGPITTAAQETALLPTAIAATDTGFTGRASWYIDNGQIELYAINRMPDGSTTNIGPGNIGGAQRLLQNTNFFTKFSAAYPLYVPAGITDRSLYDWTSVNMAAPNFTRVKGETSALEVEQYILNTPRHTLAFQGSYLKERTGTNSRAFLGHADGGRMQVFIDINERMLDGTPNPYFLRPYVGGSEPAFRKSRNHSENYRGTLGYRLDLTREDNFLRHLGSHNFSGYSEYREILGGSLGFKDTIASTESWMGANGPSNRNGAAFRAYPRYYVGDATGGNVDYAPTRIEAPSTVTLRYFNNGNGTWTNEPVEFTEYYYANRLNRRLLSTYGGAWQGFLLDGRIVPNVGFRRDFNRTREGNSAINPSLATNGFYDRTPMDFFGQNDWVGRRGKTKNYGVVVKPLSWLHLTYSESNSFNPGSLAYDIHGRPLPDPQGETKDYGFSLSLFRDQGGRPRLNIVAKQFETIETGRGTSEINTIVQRAIRLDADGNGTGGDPDLEGFLIAEFNKLRPEWANGSPERDAAVAAAMGVSPDFIDSHRNRTHGDASDALSRGKEIEVIYNPTRFWRIKANVVQAKAFNAMMSPQLQQYVADRLPVWTTIRSPFDNSPFWNGTYRVGNSTPEAWFNQNLNAPMKLAVATQGKRRTQTREWRVNAITNFQFAGITENRWLKPLDVGGGVRWEDKASIGFFGAAPDADGVVRSLDPSRPIWDKARYYVDLSAGYSFRVFNDRVRTRLQFNVRNVFEDGRLQAVGMNPDGNGYLFRIIDPRQFLLTATFDL